MLKLYYSPGAISLATHIALEEAELPYELVRVALAQGEHLTPEYRRIHPLSRVPALEIGGGAILTETPALLGYIAALVPERELMPAGMLAAARAQEWMSLLASSLHVAFITFFRPERYTAEPAALESLRRDGKTRFFELLSHVDARLATSEYSCGERYSLCDAYMSVFYFWGRKLELPMTTLPSYSRLVASVLLRPAVQRARAQEGLSSS